MNLKYVQPNMNEMTVNYDELLKKFNECNTVKEQLILIEEINKIRDNFFSMYWLSYINYLLDIKSEFWNEQESFFAKNQPIMENYKLLYYKALNESKFIDDLIPIIREKVFKIANYEVRLLSDDIATDLEMEKELSNEYYKTISSLKANFDGKELTLKQLGKYTLSTDRDTRILACNERFRLLKEIENDIDNIFDKLVTVRTNIARKLGFNSYTEIGYYKMKRLDYNKSDIEMFRKQILKYIVPFVLELKEKQRLNLGIDRLMYYDDSIYFKDGNAKLLGDVKFVTNKALEMYKNIDIRLYDLFKIMLDNNLMDLDSRPGKASTGITTYIPEYRVPIFISSFNGTEGDISFLTHEFGHSFQLYSSRNLKYYENWWPTFDTCEIHSKSMELLTLPYMELFFGNDKEKYIYSSIYSVLNYLCYICAIDEFQHIIYDNPDYSILKRKDVWRELERKYMPWLDFGDNEYLERGNNWHKQSHLFNNPFYFIDYALADTIALQFYMLSLNDQEGTWKKYIDFCSQGGTYTFLESINKNDLVSPFDERLFKNLLNKIKNILK